MDQHAIPQDVTGFQFKLIGSMTVKQFGYVAVGVVSAVVLYYLPLHFALAFLIKALLIPTFGASGFIVAFLPIDGRPVDVMAGNFFKAFMAPNQYVYHKVGYTFSFSNITTTKAPAATENAATSATPKEKQKSSKELQLQMYLQNSQSRIKNALDERESAFLKNISTTATPAMPAPTPATLHTVAPQPRIAPQPKPMPLPTIPKPAVTPSPVMTTITHTGTPIPMTTIASAQRPTSLPAAPIQSVQPPAVAAPVSPIPQENKPTDVGTLIQEENALEKQLETAKNEEKTQQSPQDTTAMHQKVLTLEQQLQKIHEEKLRLEQELVKLKQQREQTQPAATQPTQPVIAAPVLPQAQPAQTFGLQKPAEAVSPQFSVAQVKTTPQPQKNSMVPHIPDTPNILVGIVKDSRGNVLPHILVEVKDKDGNPVRAFKTNALGQFASATPLTNGIYTIELEDPKRQNTFDVIQVVANNKIILPLEVVSHDAREQLRRELFN